MTTLRDALAAARINRIKARAAAAWKKRHGAEACTCPVCAGGVGGIAAILRAIRPDDDDPTPPAAANLN